jgi:hypothetical protein
MPTQVVNCGDNGVRILSDDNPGDARFDELIHRAGVCSDGHCAVGHALENREAERLLRGGAEKYDGPTEDFGYLGVAHARYARRVPGVVQGII